MFDLTFAVLILSLVVWSKLVVRWLSWSHEESLGFWTWTEWTKGASMMSMMTKKLMKEKILESWNLRWDVAVLKMVNLPPEPWTWAMMETLPSLRTTAPQLHLLMTFQLFLYSCSSSCSASFAPSCSASWKWDPWWRHDSDWTWRRHSHQCGWWDRTWHGTFNSTFSYFHYQDSNTSCWTFWSTTTGSCRRVSLWTSWEWGLRSPSTPNWSAGNSWVWTSTWQIYSCCRCSALSLYLNFLAYTCCTFRECRDLFPDFSCWGSWSNHSPFWLDCRCWWVLSTQWSTNGFLGSSCWVSDSTSRPTLHALHKVKTDSEIPIEPSLLDPIRVTVAKFSDGTVEIINDDAKSVKAFPKTWTGMTVYQITGTARRELCMYANLPAKENRTKMMRTQKKVDKNGVNEKTLTLDQRALFQEAKRKELRSFFENEVWQFDSVQNSEASRTLTARMLLKWSKNEDGSPRAKARLIVRGYADVDALQGSLETSSPTTTRLSRSFLLSLATMCGWKLWTSDISTAFLQGLPQERKLWVKLPAECLRLLGTSEDTRIVGEARLWATGCSSTILDDGTLKQSVDCDPSDYDNIYWTLAPSSSTRQTTKIPINLVFLDLPSLVKIVCVEWFACMSTTCLVLVVQILCVSGCDQSPSANVFLPWMEGWRELRVLWCQHREDAWWNPSTTSLRVYLKKVKPMTLAKHLGPESELSNQEVTALRGLLGALQWPAVQSSPHLQASTSIYSGSVSRGLVKTALEANRLLKFAKDNADVGLTYAPLDLKDVRIVTAFDASFGCRPDRSSQGGFVVMLAPRKILETEEGDYHILDWRSLKLPRTARSSLAAEAQAAACASDATEFACRYFEHLRSPTVPLRELLHMKSNLEPVLITDAKALFHSCHRDSIVSSVTDRRISLEIRVVKEQMMSLGGTLRWVLSSERQLADGLTKDSARQLLADRLRRARVKFLYDPEYTRRRRSHFQSDFKVKVKVRRQGRKPRMRRKLWPLSWKRPRMTKP